MHRDLEEFHTINTVLNYFRFKETVVFMHTEVYTFVYAVLYISFANIISYSVSNKFLNAFRILKLGEM